jgi:hypothetical protein
LEARGDRAFEGGIACRRREERDGPAVCGRQQSGELQRSTGLSRAADRDHDAVSHLASERASPSDQDRNRRLFDRCKRSGATTKGKHVMAVAALA